ncbi:hypothetical protein BDZ45DRAFT_148011 [Acephala macrosclerotiorum]|nr:hypothetical protein BDZ45DRAFT_148011 [Acephala macrosclerotiorum]
MSRTPVRSVSWLASLIINTSLHIDHSTPAVVCSTHGMPHRACNFRFHASKAQALSTQRFPVPGRNHTNQRNLISAQRPWRCKAGETPTKVASGNLILL